MKGGVFFKQKTVNSSLWKRRDLAVFFEKAARFLFFVAAFSVMHNGAFRNLPL